MVQSFFKAALFFLAALYTQETFSQIAVGIFGGPQLTSAKYKVAEIKQPVSFKPGIQLGATIKVPFENNLYFGPAIYYSTKGYKVTLNKPAFPPTEFAKNNETTIHTIEIVPMLHYDFSAKPAHFFVKLGPAIDFAFSGREKFELMDGKLIKRAMAFSFTEYGRITAQAILHVGYQSSKGIIVFAHYGEGLGSLNNADGGPRIKHRIAGISFGWFFRKKLGRTSGVN